MTAKCPTMQAFTRYQLVPDSLVNADGGVDPAKVRWHVVEQGVNCPDHIYSYATIQEAFWHIGGESNPTPVIPCGRFHACKHCHIAMQQEREPR